MIHDKWMHRLHQLYMCEREIEWVKVCVGNRQQRERKREVINDRAAISWHSTNRCKELWELDRERQRESELLFVTVFDFMIWFDLTLTYTIHIFNYTNIDRQTEFEECERGWEKEKEYFLCWQNWVKHLPLPFTIIHQQ